MRFQPHEWCETVWFGFLFSTHRQMNNSHYHLICAIRQNDYHFLYFNFSSRNLIYFAFSHNLLHTSIQLFMFFHETLMVAHHSVIYVRFFLLVWNSLSKRLNLWYCLLCFVFFFSLASDGFIRLCWNVEMLIGMLAVCCCCCRFSLIYTWCVCRVHGIHTFAILKPW